MLHELLVVLAGFESSLTSDEGLKSQLHPSEAAMISEAHRFGKYHARISKLIANVHTSEINVSPVGYAVASSVQINAIKPFQQTLIEMEQRILARDSAFIGGDSFVSLTQIITLTVRDWLNLFQYSESLMRDITTHNRSGPEIINRLRRDYDTTSQLKLSPLIRHALAAAEKSWVAQVASWIVYGRLPSNTEDFMIVSGSVEEANSGKFILVMSRIPSSINIATANDILTIGTCLEQSRSLGGNNILLSSSILRDLEYPIVSEQLSSAVDNIKSQVFEKVFTENVDMEEAALFLQFLRRIVLLESLDFTDIIFSLFNNQHLSDDALNYLFTSAFDTLLEDCPDERYAEQLFSCCKFRGISVEKEKFSDIPFNTAFELKIEPKWPYNMLVSPEALAQYSRIFIYLLSIRRAMFNLVHTQKEPGFIKMKLKLFFDALWQHCQSIIQVEFDRLSHLFRNDYPNVIQNHDTALKKIVNSFLLDDETICQTIRKLMIFSGSKPSAEELIEQIRVLVYTIEGLTVMDKFTTNLLVVLDPLNA